MKTELKKENNENNNSKYNRNLEKDISKMELNRIEDDIKNVINEKDEIIKNMNDKIIRLENIIKGQNEKNEQLFKMMNSMKEFNEELKRSNYFDIEISGTDKEINDLKGIGFDIEMFNEKSFDDYFKTDNQIEPNKIIFSICQKKNDKIPIKELVSNIVSKLESEFMPAESHLYEKYKDKGIQFKIRQNNRDCIIIDFYVDKNFLYESNKGSVNDKDKKENTTDENQETGNNIFETIYKKLDFSNFYDKSYFNFYFKMFLRSDFLFKYLFEADFEEIIKNKLNFKIIANSDINTKIFILFIIDKLLEVFNKEENKNIKDLLSSIKTLLSIPLKKIKYDLIDNNKKDIYDLAMELYNEFKHNIEKLKNVYNSKDLKKYIEEEFKVDKTLKEIFEIFIKIIDLNELRFAFGISNNKLGFQISNHLPEDNEMNCLFLLFPIILLMGFIFFCLNLKKEN